MKLNNWKENAVIAGGIIGITLIFVLFIDGPIRKNIRQAEQDLHTSRIVLGGLPSHVQELENLQSRIKQTKAYLERTKSLVPSEENVDQVLEIVTELGRQSTLNISRLEPISTVPLESYEELPFRLVAKGSYEGINNFCYSLENGDRLFGVDELTLSGGNGENAGNVELEMVFTAYVDRSVQ
ncbi:MAG: type 4a pilus biogenesis protein PilO [Planctomycetaceae bacterium]|nr:type 4a pilus biogenesis protein PilO [Planctomycetaceae bacterium]